MLSEMRAIAFSASACVPPEILYEHGNGITLSRWCAYVASVVDGYDFAAGVDIA